MSSIFSAVVVLSWSASFRFDEYTHALFTSTRHTQVLMGPIALLLARMLPHLRSQENMTGAIAALSFRLYDFHHDPQSVAFDLRRQTIIISLHYFYSSLLLFSLYRFLPSCLRDGLRHLTRDQRGLSQQADHRGKAT